MMSEMKTLTQLMFLFCFSTSAAVTQSLPKTADVHAEIQKIYDFQPHTLTSAQIAQKSALLDQFWTKATSQRDVYIPALRRELADTGNPPFFLFDGSKLLMSLSNDPADRKIIVSALAHTDLRDLQWTDYFLFVQSMAAKGEDTTAAAFNILVQPKFQAFIPLHSLTLNQDFCLIYMLLPTDQSFWLHPAIARLHTEPDVTAQKSLLLLLWYAQTSDSDQALRDFSSEPGKPQVSKDYARKLINPKEITATETDGTESTTNEETLRQARRERLKVVSDEALYDLDSYTVKIIAMRKSAPGTTAVH